MARMQATSTVVVARPPEDVFNYLRDVHRHNEWSPKPYRVEGIEGPVGAGSTFVSYGWIPGDAEHRNEVEVTNFEPSRRIEFTAREQGEEFFSTYVLTPDGEGTRVDKIINMPRPSGLIGVLFPVLFSGLIKPATNKGMGMLKERLEKGS